MLQQISSIGLKIERGTRLPGAQRLLYTACSDRSPSALSGMQQMRPASSPNTHASGKLMVMLDRGDYWQCAYVIPKGGIDRVKLEGPRGFPRPDRRNVAASG